MITGVPQIVAPEITAPPTATTMAVTMIPITMAGFGGLSVDCSFASVSCRWWVQPSAEECSSIACSKPLQRARTTTTTVVKSFRSSTKTLTLQSWDSLSLSKSKCITNRFLSSSQLTTSSPLPKQSSYLVQARLTIVNSDSISTTNLSQVKKYTN